MVIVATTVLEILLRPRLHRYVIFNRGSQGKILNDKIIIGNFIDNKIIKNRKYVITCVCINP